MSEAEGTARAKSLWQEGAQKSMKASVAGVQKMGRWQKNQEGPDHTRPCGSHADSHLKNHTKL